MTSSMTKGSHMKLMLQHGLFGNEVKQDGIEHVIKYGIAFSLKSCKVLLHN